VSYMEAFQRAVAPTLQVELPTMSTTASNPDSVVGEECRKTELDTAVREGARSLDLKAARSLPETVAATWKVHRLREIFLMTPWVPDYYKNPVIQQRSSHV
jgi:hypothetical protein